MRADEQSFARCFLCPSRFFRMGNLLQVESKVTSEVRTQNGITILSLFRVNGLHTTIKAKYKIQIQT